MAGLMARSEPRTWLDELERMFPTWMTSPFTGLDTYTDRDAIRIEDYREGDEHVVRAEMPGVDPDQDIDITVSDHTLRISVERTERRRSEEKGRTRSEFRYGSFLRTVPLPPGANESDLKAAYHDGILEVRIPLTSAGAGPTRIPIEHT